MTTEHIPAIDVHGHYGPYWRHECPELSNRFYSGDAETIVRRATAVNVEWTVVSPLLGLLPRGEADAAVGNEEAARVVAETDGLLQWVIVDPTRPKTYEQAEAMLRLPKCVGIKVHPEEHVYPIREHGRAVFEFAARHDAVVLIHSGHEHSLPADIVPFVNDHPNVRLILAHIGCSSDFDRTLQVRGVQASRHGNVFADTSSMMSTTPEMIEWAVDEIGADRVLFGTDTPIYFTAMQRARIDHAELGDDVKKMILRDNAAALLGL
ncbi:MAG: hypothetical protein CMJ18_26255 [Phycisphaeraceae bacterium]|nr:hypothetical protein [Phycisphaeraceae bacterium]